MLSAKKQVYFYTETAIIPSGMGTNLRQYSNIRAYLDLGLPVKVIHFTKVPMADTVQLPTGAQYVPLKIHFKQPSLYERFAYKVGFPLEWALSVLYPNRQGILDAVLENEHATPGAIHHFEYPATANVAISLLGRGLNLIWSCHDWESDRNRKLAAMRAEVKQGKNFIEQMRRQYYAHQVEKRLIQSCNLVLMIAEHETHIFRQSLGGQNVHWLPMSLPQENIIPRTRLWLEGGVLRLFHLGSLNSMVPYSSMRYLLGEVFPRLPAEILARVELWVVGQNNQGEYCHEILRMAKNWPQVRFFGFVDDIEPFLSQVDVQVVGSQFATGLRTRIVESFARGVPVISTNVAAEGVVGMIPEKNILLASTADEFVAHISNLLANPILLPSLAAEAHAVYLQYYSRAVQAACLDRLIKPLFAS